MHPFQRLGHHALTQRSPTNNKKDRCGVENPDKQSGKDEIEQELCNQREMLRKRPHSKTNERCDRKNWESLNQRSVPVINATSEGTEIRQQTKPNDILRAKEKVLWSNTSTEWDDNTERLGPNKNSIIEESLTPKNM